MTEKYDEISRKYLIKDAEYIRASMTLQEAEEEAYFQNSLLPCPFCGGHAEAAINRDKDWRYNGHILSIICTNCGNAISFRGILSPDDARNMWNTRNKAVASGGSKAASHYQLLSQQPIEIMQTFLGGRIPRLPVGQRHQICAALRSQGRAPQGGREDSPVCGVAHARRTRREDSTVRIYR